MASILLPTQNLNINTNTSSAISGNSQKTLNAAQGINTKLPFIVKPSAQLRFMKEAVQVVDEWEKRTRQNKLDLLGNQAKNELQRELNDNLASYQSNKGQNAINAYEDFVKNNNEIKERYSQIFSAHGQANYDFNHTVNDYINRVNIEGKNYHDKVVSEQAENESFNRVKETLNTATLNYNSPLKTQYEDEMSNAYSDYLERYQGIVKGSEQEQAAQRALKDEYIASAISYQISTKQYGLANANLEREKLDNLSSITYWRLKSKIFFGIEEERQRAQANTNKSLEPMTVVEQEQAVNNLTGQYFNSFSKEQSIVNTFADDYLKDNEEYIKNKAKLDSGIINPAIFESVKNNILKSKDYTDKLNNYLYGIANEKAKLAISQENLVRKANKDDKAGMAFYYAKQIQDYIKTNPYSMQELLDLSILDKMYKGKIGSKELLNQQLAFVYGSDSNSKEQFKQNVLGMIDIAQDSFRQNNDELLTKSSPQTIKNMFADADGIVNLRSIQDKASIYGYRFSMDALSKVNYDQVNRADSAEDSNLNTVKKVVNTSLSILGKKDATRFSTDIATKLIKDISKDHDITKMSRSELSTLATAIMSDNTTKQYASALEDILEMSNDIVKELVNDKKLNYRFEDRPENAAAIIYDIGKKLYEETNAIPSEETLIRLINERDNKMQADDSRITNSFNKKELPDSHGNIGGYKEQTKRKSTTGYKDMFGQRQYLSGYTDLFNKTDEMFGR